MKQNDALQVELPYLLDVLFCFVSGLAAAEPYRFDGM